MKDTGDRCSSLLLPSVFDCIDEIWVYTIMRITRGKQMERLRGKSMDHLKFIIPGKPEYLTMVRLAITSVATTAGFDLEATEDIKTAVCEACKNISCHGFSGFSDQYEVDCNVEKGKIDIIVKDDCSKHTLEKLNPPCRKCPQEGDLGVFVIESLMNEVHFDRDEDGRKRISMTKRV